MNKKFTGTGVAIVTPFHKYGTIDFTSFGRIIEHVISGGVNYIVALGTTGESVTLTNDEKTAVIDYLVENVDSRVPLVVGMGGNNTQDVVDFIKSVSFDGIDAILSVSPYYNKPQQNGLYRHYENIATACPVPVILYNVPGRTSSNLLPDTVVRLANNMKNIIGIKEASGNLAQCMEIIKNKPDDFLVISGDDLLTLPMISIGGNGVISVVANAFPTQFSEMVNAALKGNYKTAKEIHYKFVDIINSLFADGNPAGIKAAMDVLGLCSNSLRLPLVKANKAVYHQIKTLIQELDA